MIGRHIFANNTIFFFIIIINKAKKDFWLPLTSSIALSLSTINARNEPFPFIHIAEPDVTSKDLTSYVIYDYLDSFSKLSVSARTSIKSSAFVNILYRVHVVL